MRPRRGILLDSHVLLWVLEGSPRVGKRLAQEVEDGRPLYFSAVTVAELAIKALLGKMPSLSEIWPQLPPNGFTELPFTAAHATSLERFGGLANRDPFDRMLVAQAVTNDLWFETADQTLLNVSLGNIRDATA